MTSKALFKQAALMGWAGALLAVTPQQTQQQLDKVEVQFEEAKEIFNPWYAGPLITGSANTLSKGTTNVQPYLYITNTYGVYDHKRKVKSIDEIFTLSPQLVAQWGITDKLVLIVAGQVSYNNQLGASAWNFADTSVGLAYGILTEGPYLPAIRLGVTESFPSGRYQHLQPRLHATDATGSGSYKTTFTLNLSKVVWWLTLHPMSFRSSLNYTVPSNVHVDGFNSYGGGYGTDGKVRVGNSFTIDVGYEFSMTQQWVLAFDLVYQYNNASPFSGKKGVYASGKEALVGLPSSDQFSLAPAIEYNPSANLGWIAGIWFSATGRDSAAFVSGVLSMSYTY